MVSGGPHALLYWGQRRTLTVLRWVGAAAFGPDERLFERLCAPLTPPTPLYM